MNFNDLINSEKIIKTRRDLHQIPELGFQEQKTSNYIIEYLKNEGIEFKANIAKHGILAHIDTGKPGPVLMIRADMDALPILENTDLPFASTHEGCMHACGHDAHVAMVLGAASLINKIKGKLKGSIKFVFQPAEEGPGGAKPMIEAGVMEDPKVDFALGCHIWPAMPTGTIGLKAGPLMAAADRFDLKIIGQGGHGAMPHECVDALEVGTQVVGAIQRIVSRHMNPLNPTVVTVGKFVAGSAFNIIPETAELCGTVRTFDREIWASLPERFEKIVRHVCQSMNAEYELEYVPGYPPTVNDAEAIETVRDVALDVVCPENIVEPEASMGAEDMSYYFEKAQGCFVFLGTGWDGCAPLHNPKFTIDETILATGVELYGRTALKLLG